MKRLLLWAGLTGWLWARPIDGFPPDPPGVIKDRLYETITLGQKEFNLYAAVVQPPGKKPAQVIIYSGTSVPQGMEWKKLHTWVLSEGGVTLDMSRAALCVAAQEPDEIQFYFQEGFKYVEGRAVAVLHYYPKTGKFEFQLAD